MAAVRRVTRWLCVAIVSPACCLLLHLQASGSDADASLRDLRYRGVIPQTSEYSCGAAAIAGLLQVYFGIPATERQVLELAERQMLARGEDPGTTRGLTAYDLKIASETLGLRMIGYELTHSQIEEYFERGGLPLIAHVTEPQSHYLVVVGTTARHVLLSDPAWGRYVAPIHELADVRRMSGVCLVPLPTIEEALHARNAQLSALEWMQARVCELANLREAMQ